MSAKGTQWSVTRETSLSAFNLEEPSILMQLVPCSGP